MIVEDLSNLIANLGRAIELGTVDLISKRVDASIGIPQIIIGIYDLVSAAVFDPVRPAAAPRLEKYA